MRQRDKQAPQSAEETVRDIRRATRRHFSAEEKIRIVLEGLRGEDSIAAASCKLAAAASYPSVRGQAMKCSACGSRDAIDPSQGR